jgi:hypothetical protein
MPNYTVRGTGPTEEFLFGVTLACLDDASARQRFQELPAPPCRMELWLGERLVARRRVSEPDAGGARRAGGGG